VLKQFKTAVQNVAGCRSKGDKVPFKTLLSAVQKIKQRQCLLKQRQCLLKQRLCLINQRLCFVFFKPFAYLCG
jgi:hypothetical protein